MGIFVTGDKHGEFYSVFKFCEKFNTTIQDTMIVLGDAGINYSLTARDVNLKKQLSKLPITLFCIHGNHECRPGNLGQYKTKQYLGGVVWVEEAYPNILFAKDGEIYNFVVDGEVKKTVVLGGAYSVDKFYRLSMGYSWFEDEQPDDKIKRRAERHLAKQNWNVDYVLSHTSPLQYLPSEWFLSSVVQKDVDNTTEKWLQDIEEKLTYTRWYCGHYHGEKTVDKLVFMFSDFRELGH